ncbi:MAG: toast rack family protein [Candidatus Zixiibacteriota bacterium]
MKSYKSLGASALMLMLSLSAVAAPVETKEFNFPADSITILYADIDLAAGNFRLTSEEMPALFRADVTYNPDRLEVFADYRKRGERGYLEVGSDLFSKFQVDTEDNRWEMELSRSYKTDLKLEFGLCDAFIDLGGVPLTDLNLDIGVAEGKLVFSSPNPTELDNISIEAGAAEFEIEKLLNANFKTLKFDGGVGEFRLEFTGELKTRAQAEISVGLGSAVIYLPRELSVRIEAEDNFLSKVKFRNAAGLRIRDGYYKSEDFDSAAARLDLRIDVGLGSVEIVWSE